MKKETRNILLTCGVLLLIVCICTGLIALTGLGISFITPQETSIAIATDKLPTPLPTLASTVELDPSIAQQMDLIQSQVISIRGLEPSFAVPRTLLTAEQLLENVMNDFLSDYTPEEARQDALELAVLGLLPQGFDLLDFYTELYSEQVAGYYDDDVKAIYVVKGETFGGNEKITYAHEYTHVLQDQIYDFHGGLGYTDENCQIDSERCAGILSLIEGDAVLTESLWFQTYATEKDYTDILDFYESYESPVFDSAPNYMQEDFIFPYMQGQAFVQSLYDQGGYAAIDQAYQNVPVSTEQILHPELYPNDKPIPVMLPDLTDTLGEGWTELDRNVMGEWFTYLILAHASDPNFRVNDSVAMNAAEGWGGDTYLVYINEETEEIILVMVSTWDTPRDLDEFYEAFMQYAQKRWGEPFVDPVVGNAWQGSDYYNSFYITGNFSTWILTPDAAFDKIIKEALP